MIEHEYKDGGCWYRGQKARKLGGQGVGLPLLDTKRL